jgi:DNA-binding MarR family transcriptional regulator
VEHFNALARGLPGIPKALLSQRLRRLQQTGIVERRFDPENHATCYRLTRAGQELYSIVDSLTQWGAKWAFGEPEPAELNPVLLLWWMRGRVCLEKLPAQRVVVEFNFQEVRQSAYWLVLKPEDVSLCVKHPGFEIDVLVIAELSAFYQVWLGRITFDQAVREQRVEVDALPPFAHAFPTWFALSPAASTVQAETRIRHIR